MQPWYEIDPPSDCACERAERIALATFHKNNPGMDDPTYLIATDEDLMDAVCRLVGRNHWSEKDKKFIVAYKLRMNRGAKR
jgi:hypothetical protein